jgi:hypothetical protein
LDERVCFSAVDSLAHLLRKRRASVPAKPLAQGDLEILDQQLLIAKSRVGLPPASSPVETAATEQNNNDYNDKKRGHVHGFSVLSQLFNPSPTTQAPFSSMRNSSAIAT